MLRADPEKYLQGRLTDHVLPDVEPFPGAVALVRIAAPRQAAEFGLEDMARGKPRPGVLSRQRGDGWWQVWGLTSLARFDNDLPRAEAVGLSEVGLAPGYVWGGRVVALPAHDVVGVVWATPLELIEACAAAEGGVRRVDAARWASELHAQHVEAGWYWPKHG